MIVADTSALVAIVYGEPERTAMLNRIAASRRTLISSGTVIEAQIVVYSGKGERGIEVLRELLAMPLFEIVAPGEAEIHAAHAAFMKYGRGRGHPARLNFGDLFGYALAKVRNLPLLYKGEDFAHTDIVPALRSQGAADR